MSDLTNAKLMIMDFEGFRANAYLCPAGIQTIGYGTTGPEIKIGMVWDKAEAYKAMCDRVDELFHQISDVLQYDYDDNEISALIDFCYNLGFAAFKGSTLLRRLNVDDPNATDELLKWDNCLGKPSKGLRARRISEYVLFNEERLIKSSDAALLIPQYYA